MQARPSNDGESIDRDRVMHPAADDHAGITAKIERLVAYGHPHCDGCYSLAPEDRPDHGAFWPDPIALYVNTDERAMVDWLAKEACGVHDDAPEDATHRVLADVELYPEHHHNGAYRYKVRDVEQL